MMLIFSRGFCAFLFVCVTFSSGEESAHERFPSAEEGSPLRNGKRDEISSRGKQENENVSLNNDRIAENSSKTTAVNEAIESIGNGEIYDGPRTTAQYETEGYATHPGREGVYEEPPPSMGEVLGPDHKQERGALTDRSGNKNDADINPSGNKTNLYDDGLVDDPSALSRDVGSVSETPGASSDVVVEDFMKSRIAFALDYATDRILSDKLKTKEANVQEPATSLYVSSTEETTNGENASSVFSTEVVSTQVTEELNSFLDPPEKPILEKSSDDQRKDEASEEVCTNFDNELIDENTDTFPNHQHYYTSTLPADIKLTTDKETVKNTEHNLKTLSQTETETNLWIFSKEKATTDTSTEQSTKKSTHEDNTALSKVLQDADEKTTTGPSAAMHDYKSLNLSKESVASVPTSSETFEAIFDVDNSHKSVTNFDNSPKAERIYAISAKNDDSLNSRLKDNLNSDSEAHLPIPQRSDEDKSAEVVIKSLLNNRQTFNKEKIEPGVLFEDCPDCDLRVLPIRASEQRSTPLVEEESLPPSKIKFADLPEGRELQINSLGLSEGIFLFSYLSEFLSYIQPNQFPVELLRDALRSEISWFSLITQSLQVEAGFVVCLVVGVLLALAVPVVVLSHACYRVGAQAEDQAESAGNCKRRTLVFVLEILLVLLLAGMVAMFVTNEQLSGAVVQSSDVLQTSLADVSAFVHNSHLQLHFLVTQALDQALQAIYADLDNVESLLGRPIQRELVRETGLDVAMESLGDLTREAKQTTQQVEKFLDDARLVQEMLVTSQDKLSDLRQQVELFRRACGPRDRVLCDTIDASGLEITLRLDRIKSDERLNRMRRMGGVGLAAAAAEAKEMFTAVPSRVEADTKDAREAVRRQLGRQRAEMDDRGLGLEKFARDLTDKVNDAKYQVGSWTQDLDQFEYWRWIICLGGGAAVLMIWTMLLCSLCCGCCGSQKAAGPTILVTVVVLCLFCTALWTVALVGLLVGGHGEVFLCRPLYDEPQYPVISDLVDHPGVFYTQPRGGFIANVIYGNDTLDVPIPQVLQDCRDNRAIYPTLGLQRVFDVEAAVDQHRWSSVSSHLRAVRANLSSLEVLSPALQDQLADLLTTLSVNFTEHRIQMSKPVTGKDLDSFARQLDNIGNQMRDLATASRMETLSSRTRRLVDSHIRPLETRKDSLVYQLTALEVQTGPLQRQVNQSLSHLKTIQFFINSQGEAIAQRKSREYVDRLLGYVEQLRDHVVHTVKNMVAPCRPLWDIFNNSRLFLCRHTMDPLNGYWFATMWCLVVLLAATPVCLKLVDYYRAQSSRAYGSPDNLMVSEQGAGWSSPGYDIKCIKGSNGDYK